MIKQEGVEIYYQLSPKGQSLTQKQPTPADIYMNYKDAGLYQHGFPNYPPLPAGWAYDYPYHPYPFLPPPYSTYDHAYLPLPPPAHRPPQINQHETLPIARPTRSQEESDRRAKVQQQESEKDQDYEVPSQYLRELTRRNGNRTRRQKYISFYWGADQNKRYLQFLVTHPGLFDLSINVKKNLRVNVMMSRKVKTRSPQQCHSHHQKMIKKHGSIDLVIQFLRREGALRKEKKGTDQVKVEDTAGDNVKQE